jgi:hypothetical protein
VVEFESADHTCDAGVTNASLRLLWVFADSERQRSVRGVDYAGRVVWTCCIFRLVFCFFLIQLNSLDLQGLFMARFKVMQGHFMRSYCHQEKKQDGKSSVTSIGHKF